MSDIVVPSLGESVSEATVAKWLKKEGDKVEQDEAVVELETDKATLEVNAPEAGVIAKISVKEGEDVEVGAVLGEVQQGEAANDSESSKDSGEKEGSEDSEEKEESDDKKSQNDESKDKSDEEQEDGDKKQEGSDSDEGGEAQDIVVPSLGESISEATIGKWLKKEGDEVEEDEPVAELETDKATMEVNAPCAGVIQNISFQEGDNVEIGAVLGKIEKDASGTSKSAKDKKDNESDKDHKSSRESEDKSESKSTSSASKKLSPAVRKMVQDNNLDPEEIEGSGKDGRITKEDVQNYMKRDRKADESAVDVSDKQIQKTDSRKNKENKNREERIKMTRLRQSIAKRLKNAQDTAAMLTTFNEVDMGAVMEVRNAYKETFEKKHGVKLGFMSFFVKAAVNALKEFPEVNAEIDGDEIVYKNYYNISVAVSTPQGLVVPVIRDCDEKSMAQIEKDLIDLGGKAREGKLAMNDMMGGTFTVTNGGIFGSLMSTPIINPPQTAIMGMHKIQQRPMVMQDGSIEARPMMYLAMSYDHRLIDGKEAVGFLVRIKEAVEDPRRLLLDL